jgi:hypothetical protein
LPHRRPVPWRTWGAFAHGNREPDARVVGRMSPACRDEQHRYRHNRENQ